MQIPERLSVPWADTLCKRALDANQSFANDVGKRWRDSEAAQALQIQTYLSTPIRLADGALYGTLCTARQVFQATQGMYQLDTLHIHYPGANVGVLGVAPVTHNAAQALQAANAAMHQVKQAHKAPLPSSR